MRPYFSWDPEKADSNIRKHGVTFAEGATVFPDPFARIKPDSGHSEGEIRELILGESVRRRLLVVSFSERGACIRIISARKATRAERHEYESRQKT